MSTRTTGGLAVAAALLVTLAVAAPSRTIAADETASSVDRIFAPFTTATPGCAVTSLGVSQDRVWDLRFTKQ